MSFPASFCLFIYFSLLAILSVYGVHRTWLLLRLKRVPAKPASSPPGDESVRLVPEGHDAPFVTIQLPIYNERFVVERLITAVASLRYPRSRFEIQVLDDSTDDTSDLVARCVARYRADGIDIRHLRRTSREGYKAGALAEGLRHARGDLIAVFDADFKPSADFLERIVPYFSDPCIGMVQARWSHINEGYSALTRAQAALLDGHFLIEHASRHCAGHFFNFNGTAGVWRRSCIESAGGWQHDTLTEDLDLSYRAQLAGWKFHYLPDLEAPAELPVEMAAFRSQQMRWAKGSIQTGLKLLPRLMLTPLPLSIRIEAFFHLTANLCYVWMTGLALLMPPAMVARMRLSSASLSMIDGPLIVLSLLSISLFYLEAQRLAGVPFPLRLKRLPMIMAVGAGLSLSNAVAVIEALMGIPSPFKRTPKHGIEGREGRSSGYHSPVGWLPWIELAMALYLGCAIVLALAEKRWLGVPFMLLFSAGFFYVGLMSILEIDQPGEDRPLTEGFHP